MLNVYLFPADSWACGHYRLAWPGQVANREPDINVKLIPNGSGVLSGFRLEGNVSVSVPEDADVLVFQRPTKFEIAEAIAVLASDPRLTVIVDMDDDLSQIHPANPAHDALHPKRSPEDNWRWAAEACRAADWVTVTTDKLAEVYGAHGRVSVLPNFVPERFLTLPRVETSCLPVVSWPANIASHPDDTRVVGGGLAASGLPVRIVGPDPGRRMLGIPEDRWSTTGPVPFDGWPETLAGCDVGVAPLADTRFNESKSWLKPLELAACGVPVLMSPTTSYLALNELGIGGVCARPADWRKALRRAQSRQWRDDMSGRGRAIVAGGLTIEQNGWRWAETWTHAASVS